MQERSKSKKWIGSYNLTFVLFVKLSFKVWKWQIWKYHHECKKVNCHKAQKSPPSSPPELYSTFPVPESLYHNEGGKKGIFKVKHISSKRNEEIERKKYIGSLQFLLASLQRTKVNTDSFPFRSLFLAGLYSVADLIHCKMKSRLQSRTANYFMWWGHKTSLKVMLHFFNFWSCGTLKFDLLKAEASVYVLPSRNLEGASWSFCPLIICPSCF